MSSEDEIKQKIIEVQSLKLPKNEPDRYYAEQLKDVVINILEWVLQENNQ